MKFSLDWLRQYVDLPEPPDRIAALLAAAGLPCDALLPWGQDTILDLDVLSNRPDCMGHVGLAREIAARGARPLRPPAAEPARGALVTRDLVRVAIDEPGLCPRYTALVLTAVKIAPAPDWLQDRITAIGLRPVNNVVDITNFVLHELGQPLHAFDLDRLKGPSIVVRRAAPGEILRTLDGVERRLDPSDLVIADAARPVALAGVMGGQDAEIGPATRRVLIESACFSPAAIRRTARVHALRTDASHRFARGSDVGITRLAARRAAALIVECAGAELAREEIDLWPERTEPTRILFSPGRAGRLLGLDLPEARAMAALRPLGFTGAPAAPDADGPVIAVTVPTWRVDVERQEDVVEEVARMLGYDAIGATLPGFAGAPGGAPRPGAALDRARRFMAAAGFFEAIHFPMVSTASQEPFAALLGRGRRPVLLDNPLGPEMREMRTTLIPGLLGSLRHNLNRGREGIRLFEIGRRFADPVVISLDAEGRVPLPEERPALAVAALGGDAPSHWSRKPAPLGLYHLTGLALSLGEAVHGKAILAAAPADPGTFPFLDPSEQARLELEGRPIGYAGRLQDGVAAAFDLPLGVLVMELGLEGAPAEPPLVRARPLPRFPASSRDLACILPEEVAYDQLASTIRSAAGEWLETVELFDRYVGEPVPPGSASLAVRLTFRHPDRTLTAVEVDDVSRGVMEALATQLGATLRTAREGP